MAEPESDNPYSYLGAKLSPNQTPADTAVKPPTLLETRPPKLGNLPPIPDAPDDSSETPEPVKPIPEAAGKPDYSSLGAKLSPNQAPMLLQSHPQSTTLGPEEMEWGAKWLPAIGATTATIAAPEVAWPLRVGYAALGGAGGSMLQQGAETALGSPDAPQSLGQFAANTAKAGAIQGGMELGSLAITKPIEWGVNKFLNPEELYQSGLKPSGTSQQDVSRTIKAGLEEKIPTSREGFAKTQKRIDELGNQIEQVITSKPANISPQQYVGGVESNLNTLRDQWGKDATQGADFVRQIDQFEKNFLLNHGNVQPITTTTLVQQPMLNANGQAILNASGQPLMKSVPQTITKTPEEMTLAELRTNAQPLATGTAQEIKQATYNTIRSTKGTAWDSGTHPGLEAAANTQIASAMREQLEQVYPNLKLLNEKQGALIELKDELDRFIKREANKQRLPYFIFPAAGAMLGAGAGGAEGTALGAVAGHYLRSALENPAFKSKLAIALYHAARMPGAKAMKAVAGQVPGGALRIGETALGTDWGEQQPQVPASQLRPPGQARGGGVAALERRALKRETALRHLTRAR